MPAGRKSPARTRRSPHAEADGQIAALRALEFEPEEQEREALALLAKSKHLNAVQVALSILQERAHPGLRLPLHEKYEWCDGGRDPGGFIRAGIIHALRPIINDDDLPILYRAVATYEMQGMYELCAGVRAAALLAFLDLDMDLGSLFATRLLNDPRNSFSEEPAMTAARVLASCQNLPPLFAYASFPQGSGAVTGEVLRSLVDLPGDLVPFLIAAHRDSEDEQVLLGLFDLLLGHPQRDRWRSEITHFMRTTELIDLYGIIAMQIVASRDEPLITELRDLAGKPLSRDRQYLLDHALEHA
jgi:hypothetical protein